jgi:hypothetical protein
LADSLLRKPFRSAGRSSSYAIALDPLQAAAARDAVCAASYARLFDWLVRRVASALAPALDDSSSAPPPRALTSSADDQSRAVPSIIRKAALFRSMWCEFMLPCRCKITTTVDGESIGVDGVVDDRQ